MFVALDVFTKFVKLYPVKKATSLVLAKKIVNEYIAEVGRPKIVLSDHGSQFTSNTWRETLGWENILVKHTSVYHPQSNPSERVMWELGCMFRTFCHQKHSLWATFVNKIEEMCIRDSY